MFYILQFSYYYEFKLTHAFPNHSLSRVSSVRPPSYALPGGYRSCTGVTCFVLASVAVGRRFNANSGKYFSWGNFHTFPYKKFLKIGSLHLDPVCFFIAFSTARQVFTLSWHTYYMVNILHNKRGLQCWRTL